MQEPDEKVLEKRLTSWRCCVNFEGESQNTRNFTDNVKNLA